jgi:hypothetical protein
MVPYWSPTDGLKFALVLKTVFPDSASAEKTMEALPRDWTHEASVLGPWHEGTLFFTEDLPAGL